jgi:hypothetical protein
MGIAKHTGSQVAFDATGVLRTWEPINEGKYGHLGCAVVLPPNAQRAPAAQQESSTICWLRSYLPMVDSRILQVWLGIVARVWPIPLRGNARSKGSL